MKTDWHVSSDEKMKTWDDWHKLSDPLWMEYLECQQTR